MISWVWLPVAFGAGWFVSGFCWAWVTRYQLRD